MSNSIETLRLNNETTEDKYKKNYDKLLPIKIDNTIVIYHVSYKESKIKDLITKINNKYTINTNDIINTIVLEDVPLSFGKYDKIPYVIIKGYQMLSINSKDSNSLVQVPDLYFPKERKATLKLNIDILPALSILLEETFLTDDNMPILDLTDLIRYRNYIFNIPNEFDFDKTIDLYNALRKKSSNYKFKINKFPSLQQYKQHLIYLANCLNDNTLFLNEREEKKIRNDIYEFIYDLYQNMDFEDIAMFPLGMTNTNSKDNETREIIAKFGARNTNCNFKIYDTNWNGWFGDKLDFAKSNINGAKIYNELSKDIIFNYDLDGIQYEQKLLKNMKNNNNLNCINFDNLDDYIYSENKILKFNDKKEKAV